MSLCTCAPLFSTMLWRRPLVGHGSGDQRRVTWSQVEPSHSDGNDASDRGNAEDVLADGVASMAAPAGGSGAAVAAALGGGPGAAVAASPEDLASVVVDQSFRLNNIALTWIWDSHEEPPGKPAADRVDLTHSDPLEIGVIERTSGMNYCLKEGRDEAMVMATNVGGFESGSQGANLGC